MGLSQQIAYSSLLAFFPAMAFLVGALGLFHLFGDVKSLLDPIAPNGVIKFITSLQQDTKGGTSVAAFLIGFFGAVWAASGAMTSVLKAVNKAYERPETRPFWKVRGDRDHPRRLERDHDRGHLPADRRRRLARRRDQQAGRSRRRISVDLGNRPLADRLLRDPALLRARLLPRPEQGAAQLEVGHARLVRRRRAVAPPLGALRPLRHVRRELHEDVRDDRKRGHPLALAQLLGVRAALRRGAQRRARPAGRHSSRRR